MHQIIYKRLLYFISLVILVTLTIQVYWNYKNYRSAQQLLHNEVQSIVDRSIDSYFIERAAAGTMALQVDKGGNVGGDASLIQPGQIEQITVVRNEKDQQNRSALAGTLLLSLRTDSLDVSVLSDQLEEQFRTRDLFVEFAWRFRSRNGTIQTYNEPFISKAHNFLKGHSAYLPKNSELSFYYGRLTGSILKRNSVGILLSGFLVVSVIFCLFFLLRIIARQKELSAIKEDLLNNLTHEFQTPIATAKVALEGIQNFNGQNDPVKTRNYLDIAGMHLDKLQGMVEKLLETVNLEKGQFQIRKEKEDLVLLLTSLLYRYEQLAPDRKIFQRIPMRHCYVALDKFHMEHALNSVLDNAIKYGGFEIEVQLKKKPGEVQIIILDSGTGLTGGQARHIFEKFYRVPQGNIQEARGYGIGLYYAKQVVEAHGGTIEVCVKDKTKFIFCIPDGKTD